MKSFVDLMGSVYAMIVFRRVWIQGHSRVVTLPSWMCDHLGIIKGTEVRMTLLEGRGIMREPLVVGERVAMGESEDGA